MPPGSVTGVPRILLRLEGVVVLAAAISAYAELGQSWWLFAALFLVPDLGMLGYLRDPRLGAAGYNLMHTYAAPGLLAAAGFLGGSSGRPFVLAVASVWVAHIGFDRAVGYGLKYASAFKDTHLGRP